MLEAVSPGAQEAFNGFVSDPSLFALLLKLSSGELEALPTIAHLKDAETLFPKALAQLNSTVNTKTPLYLIIRRNAFLTLITYVPYLADTDMKSAYVENRHELIQQFGEKHFSVSVICKEPGEILDERSWNERDGEGESWSDIHEHDGECGDCTKEVKQRSFKDLGYKKNKCRLCDRRMRNDIEQSALDALKKLNEAGDCVQMVSVTDTICLLYLTTTSSSTYPP